MHIAGKKTINYEHIFLIFEIIRHIYKYQKKQNHFIHILIVHKEILHKSSKIL